MFPKSTTKTAGSSFNTQNEETGTFYGHIKSMRPIKSDKNPTCFGVLDIQVKGKNRPFQFYLNYNPDKKPDRENGSSPESRSVEYMVSKTKDLIKACGETPDLSAVRDMSWCEEVIKALIQSGKEFWFEQSKSSRGLEIDFLEEAPEGVNPGDTTAKPVQW